MIRALGWAISGGSGSIFLSAIHAPDQITIGSLIVALAVGAAGLWSGAASKRRTTDLKAAAEAWKEERDAEKAKSDRLEEEAIEREAHVVAVEKQLAVAEARTDITRVESLIGDSYREAIAERDLQHKERLAIIEQVKEQSTHTVEVLVSVRQSLDALTSSIVHLVDKGANPAPATEGDTT